MTPKPGVGDQCLAAGDQLGAPPGAQVDQLQVTGAAAAQPDHGAPPVARHRAHPRGGAGREHRGRAVADVDEAGLAVAAALGEHGDADHAAGGRPGAEGGRGGAGREVADLAGGGIGEVHAGALAAVRGDLQGDPGAVGGPGQRGDVGEVA